MVSFKARSTQPELMDSKDIPPGLLYKNLGELDVMNRTLGGHNISLEGIQDLITDRQKLYHIVDIGCGSGDVLKFIARWARSHSVRVVLTGVDRNTDAIDYLVNNCREYPEIKGVVSDYTDYLASGVKIDIVHCSLFCHHLNDSDLITFFKDLKQCTRGFVINDLQRHPVAYYSVWLLTRMFLGSSLSKHDGPVSVSRAFKRYELFRLLAEAGITDLSVQWRWAFRYLVIAKTG